MFSVGTLCSTAVKRHVVFRSTASALPSLLDYIPSTDLILPNTDHSLVVLTGFVATLERWLSVFKDGHVMGLRLADTPENTSSG